MDWRTHIVSNPEILLGKPTIKGTRISVQLILELKLEGGWADADLLEAYPHLQQEQLDAVYAFVKDTIRLPDVARDIRTAA